MIHYEVQCSIPTWANNVFSLTYVWITAFCVLPYTTVEFVVAEVHPLANMYIHLMCRTGLHDWLLCEFAYCMLKY